MQNIYQDGAYLESTPNWHQEDSRWKAEQVARMLRKHDIMPSTVTEIGCGAGEVLNCLATTLGAGVRFLGYDISPQAFDICSGKESPRLHFVLGDLFEADEPNVDVMMALDVFEHVEDYFGFLRRLKDKGTYKIFHIPLELSVQSVVRSSRILRNRSSRGHLHYFTKETALATLRDTGYEVLDYQYTSGGIDLAKPGWKTNLMKPVRRLFFSLNQDLAVRVVGGFSLLVLTK